MTDAERIYELERRRAEAERVYELERRMDEAERRLDAHYEALEDLAQVLCSMLPEEMVNTALEKTMEITRGRREQEDGPC